jgi:D-isomer specific 2-hydroxyacid dehydrogenase-like protein/RibD domain-containing protein
LAAAASQVDWLILALPLTRETEGMIDGAILDVMRPTARLVNVGRGKLVDEAALIDALQSGRLRGAALDVFVSEPLDQGSPLWSMESVIVSPHMSGDYVGWTKAAVALFIENFERRLRGDQLMNVVDKRTGQVLRHESSDSLRLDGGREVVFSTTLSEPRSCANTHLVARGAVEAVREMKAKGSKSMRTIGSIALCRSLLNAGLVDRFRVVVLTGTPGTNTINA